MQPNIPTRKSDREIEFYLEYGPRYGSVLKEIYHKIQAGELTSGKIIKKFFTDRCIEKFKGETFSFPFLNQENNLGHKYPSCICVSINDKVAHAPPDDSEFKPGDIISIDCGIRINGWCFDAGFTTAFAEIPSDRWVYSPLYAIRGMSILLDQTKDTSNISWWIQQRAKMDDMDIVTALTGHGIGKRLHESPVIHNATGSFIPTKMFEGLVFCVEPIFIPRNETKTRSMFVPDPKQVEVYIDSDNWTVRTVDKRPSTHWETMFCVYKNKLIDIIGISRWDI